MQIKEKKTGKLIGTDGFVVQAPTAALSIEAFAERYEIVETEKPFEEVAEVRFKTICGEAMKCDEDGVFYGPVSKWLEIADRDYYEILPDGTKKTKFTWNEAMEIEKKTNGKWRLPTEREWFAICTAFGEDKDGRIAGEALAKNISLATNEYDSYYFWSSTVYGGSDVYNLYLSVLSVNPQDHSDKGNGLSVRLVRGCEE